MPGARMLTMVTKKLNAAASEAIPSTWMPSIQNSVRRPAARSDDVGVHEPARVRDLAHQEARVHEQGPEQEGPVAERVQPRERHVPGADLKRDEVVEERGAQGHDDQEDHGGAVHGEELVEGVRADDFGLRRGQLQPHQQRLDSPHQQEDERRDPVQDADPLVINRDHPAPPAGVARSASAAALLSRPSRSSPVTYSRSVRPHRQSWHGAMISLVASVTQGFAGRPAALPPANLSGQAAA